MTTPFENNEANSDQIFAAEKSMREGAIAGFLSMGMTLIITILGATNTMDTGFGEDWLLLIDVALLAGLAIGTWFKSRVAATLLFFYFLLSKIMQISDGQFNGIIVALAFLFFYGRAMIGSFRYHQLVKKGPNLTDVF